MLGLGTGASMGPRAVHMSGSFLVFSQSPPYPLGPYEKTFKAQTLEP